MKAKLTAGIVILLLVIVFTLQNTEMVSIRFLFWGFSMSRVLMLFLVFALGLVVGWAFGSLGGTGGEDI